MFSLYYYVKTYQSQCRSKCSIRFTQRFVEGNNFEFSAVSNIRYLELLQVPWEVERVDVHCSLKATLRVSFVAGIFIGDWLYSLARAPTTVTLSQSFSNLVRSWLNTLSTKQCSAFLHFAFIIFYGAFSIQNAEVKDVNQNFMSNNLSKEKSEHPFAKKS